VDVTDELPQVGVIFDKERLVTVLEEMPGPVVPTIERKRVARPDPGHRPGERESTGSQDQMDVVRHESEAQAGHVALGQHSLEAGQEADPIPIVDEDETALDPSEHDVMNAARGIAAGDTRHGSPGTAGGAEKLATGVWDVGGASSQRIVNSFTPVRSFGKSW
jgi:hypothetical protein